MSMKSLRFRLVFSAVVIVLICTSIFSLCMAWVTAEYSQNWATERLANSANTLEDSVESWIRRNSTVISELSQQQASSPGNLASIDFAYRGGGFFNAYVGNKDGDFFIRPSTIMPESYDPRERQWYRDAIDVENTIISDPYIGQPSGYRMVTFAKSIISNDQVVGVVGASVLLNSISETILADKYHNDGFAALIDHKGIIQIHRDEALIGKPLPGLSSSFFAKPQNIGEVVKVMIDGEDYFLASAAVANHPWFVITTIHADKVFEGTRTLTKIFAFLGVVVTLVLLLLAWVLISRLLNPLLRLSDAMEGIAEGEADLRERLPEQGSIELESLARWFNMFIERIQQTLMRARENSQALIRAANEANQESLHNRSQVDAQYAEIEQVAAAMNEMSHSSNQVADNAKQAATALDLFNQSSEKGMMLAQSNQSNMSQLDKEVQRATEVILELADHSQQINSILSTIHGVAEQTNLLALNAAIEAARAGDQGRGFAVVADEVRSLSQRTREATEEIKTMIDTLQSHSQSAAEIMSNARERALSACEDVAEVYLQLKEINDTIISIKQMSDLIALASSEQNQTTEEMNTITTAISDTAAKLSQTGESASKRAQNLLQIGESIHNDLVSFRL